MADSSDASTCRPVAMSSDGASWPMAVSPSPCASSLERTNVMTDTVDLAAPGTDRFDAQSLPVDVLPIVPVRNLVLFPGTVVPVTMARPRSIAAAQAGVRAERPIGVILQREAGVDDPTPLDLHRTGTTANVLRYVTAPDGNHHLICQGQQRFRVVEFVDGHPFLAARIELIDEPENRET